MPDKKLPELDLPTFDAWHAEMKKFTDPIDMEMGAEQRRYLFCAAEKMFRPILEAAQEREMFGETVRRCAETLLKLRGLLWFAGMAYINAFGSRGRATWEGKIAIAIREELYGVEI